MATPVFCCGGECGLFAASGAHWTTPSIFGGATLTSSTAIVRSGARSLRAQTTGGSVTTTAGYTFAGNRRIGRCYVYFATLPSGNVWLVGWANGGGPAVTFQQSTSRIFADVRTSSLVSTLGATGVSVTTGVWYRLDWDFNVNLAGNDVCDVQVDGVACGQATHAGTSTASSQDVFGLNSAGGSTADVYFDDILLSETAADYPLGAGSVTHFTPTSDGTHNVVTASGFLRTLTATAITNATTDVNTLVSKVPLTTTVGTFVNMAAPAGAAEYVECVIGPASGVSTPTTGPRHVQVLATVHQAAAQAGNMEVRLNDGGTMGSPAVLSRTAVAGTTTISFGGAGYRNAPSTGAAWTAAKFNALRVRFGSPAAVDVNPDQYFDGLLIEAEFTPSATTQAVTGGTIAAGSALTAPTVKADQAVTGSTIASGSVARAPTSVLAVQSVTSGTVASTAALTAPSVAPGAVTVVGGTRAAASVLNAPSVAPGPVAVTGATIASSLTVTAPTTVSPGAVTVTTGTISSTASLAAPTLTVGPVAVTLGTIASTTVLDPPTVATVTSVLAVTSGTISSTALLRPPSVSGGAVVTRPLTIFVPYSGWATHTRRGIRATQPAATAVTAGTLYSVIDEGFRIERSTGITWEPFATP